MDIEDADARLSATSLYQSLEEKGKFMGRVNLLYSVYLVGKISPHLIDQHDVQSYFEGLLSQFKSPDQITGLVMVYPYHVVNIIETSFRSLMKVLRHLNETEKLINCYIEKCVEKLNRNLPEDSDPIPFTGFDREAKKQLIEKHQHLAPLVDNKILFIRSNLASRVYRTFEVLTFDMEPASLNQYDNSEPDEKKLLDTIIQLTRLGIYLSKEPMKNQEEYVPELFKIKLTEILKRLREDHPELVPQQVVVGYFSEISTFEGIIPLQEYLNFYDLPYETSLQSEVTWPLPKKAFFYY
ncbi:hypothetical protein D915_003600 [Fasciola hepatica]|uniref:Uncharacterized protein n=1 Tax=Fasciola hepatica TaxID=6192 RepID=A0A4E0S266_FASHE|nr:hypothetical protein D915_003600 [Fasciola hepatica]